MTASDVRYAAGLILLVAIALAVCSWAGVAQRRAIVLASVRATAQLALVAAALRGVFAAPMAVIAVVAVMFGVAVWTAGSRLRALGRVLPDVGLACAAGASIAIGVTLGVPILHRDVRTLVAISGIVIGGCMTAATLTGRLLAEGLARRRDEVEAWLALGATMRQAVRDIARVAMHDALIPGLDQTRTVGLVTLPGTFVGALIGGAGAAGAARFQLTVLVALLCAQSTCAAVLVWRVGAPAVLQTEGPPRNAKPERRARRTREVG
jgi:putative ABC transport system permease protein